jgi:pyruvate formate lyase activating enzyme
MSFVGKKMKHEEVVAELRKDETFYRSSGGGVTLTGGDPFAQTAFSRAILKDIKVHGIHTAIETCLLTSRKDLESLLPYVDLFIVDLKVDDPAEHSKDTGASNETIKENFVWLVQKRAAMVVRIPIIPGYTDTKENLRAIGDYVAGIDPQLPIELVNFNPLARDKYTVLSQDYLLKQIDSVVPKERMNQLRQVISETGATVRLESE